MDAKQGKKSTESSKVEVGEIDTSAPFRSVKDAVSLFGAVRFMRKKPTTTKLAEPPSAAEQNIIAKETQLHLAEKELEKLKEQLQDAEATKSQALNKLEDAKKAVENLHNELLIARNSKDAAVKDTEMSMIQVKGTGGCQENAAVARIWKESLESFRDEYLAAILKLNAAEKELTKIRQDYDASLESKVCALKKASEAEEAAKENWDISSDLSNKIMVLKESILQERLATEKAQQDRARIFVEKDFQRQAFKAKIDASARQLQELGNGKDFLQEVTKEENSLKLLIESLKLELVSVKNEVVALTVKEAELESLAENLQITLGRGKSELGTCGAEELKLRSSCDELISTLSKLSSEAESSRQEVEDASMEIQVLEREAEASRISHEKAKLNLKGVLQEVEIAKSAEAAVLDQLTLLSAQTRSARSSLSSSGAKLRLSKQEFGSLKHRVMESNTLTELKVSAAMAQVDAVNASEKELINRLHSAQKEMEDLKLATADCQKRAAMSEAAKNMLEGELCRMREVELKKAAKAAAAAAASETHLASEWRHAVLESIPLEKLLGESWRSGATTLSRKALLPNLTRIFHRK